MESSTHSNMELDDEKKLKFPQIVRAQFRSLGTEIDLQIVVADEDQKSAAIVDVDEAKKTYAHFTEIFSRFEKNSELSKLNESMGNFVPASEHMQKIVVSSLEYNKKTGGLYDPRILSVLEKIGYADDFKTGVRKLADDADEKNASLKNDLADDLKIEKNLVYFGTKMDFSGIVKGYITDKISEFLIEKKWENFLVDSGGDMFMQGVDEQEKTWTVGIEGVAENKLVLTLDKKGIATSGISRRRWEIDGKRMHHIVNPKNFGQFDFDLKSVSIISDSTADADVWAKTIFLKGRIDGIIYVREHGLAAVILDYRGTAWISPKAKEFAS